MYRLVEFANQREFVDLFLSLPAVIYQGDKNYTPERDTGSWLAGTHKCAGFLRQKNLLVLRDGAPAARGIAFINTVGHFGSIGFFECVEDARAVKLLTDGAKAFCAANGVKALYAPMNGSIWSNYRLMTRGFEDKPFLGEPYNKPYYGELLTQCGFQVAKTWESQFVKKIKAGGEIFDKYVSLAKTQRAKGIRIRRMRNFDKDIRVIHKLVMNAFESFFLFHRLDEREFVDIYADLKLICDKRTIRIAYNSENQPVGFGIALPDYQSKPGFLLKYAKRYNFLYLGTLRENGESVYPQCGKAIIISILKSLFWRRKGYIRALMSEDAKTRHFSREYENLHEYALFGWEAD